MRNDVTSAAPRAATGQNNTHNPLSPTHAPRAPLQLISINCRGSLPSHCLRQQGRMNTTSSLTYAANPWTHCLFLSLSLPLSLCASLSVSVSCSSSVKRYLTAARDVSIKLVKSHSTRCWLVARCALHTLGRHTYKHMPHIVTHSHIYTSSRSLIVLLISRAYSFQICIQINNKISVKKTKEK